MLFAPKNPLEEALLRAVREPAARPQFFGLLMQSPIVILGRVEGRESGPEILPSLAGRAFELFHFRMQERPYHPIFTDPSRIEAFTNQPVERFVAIGRTLFENTRGAAFMINFGSDVGKELLPAEIDQALAPRIEIALKKPDPYPGKLTSALGMLFVNRSQIVSAHVVEVAAQAGRQPRRLLIGLVGRGDIKHVVAEVGQVLNTIRCRHSVDVLVLDPADAKDQLHRILLAVPPFYARPVTPH